jgi:hypothetical protein
VAYKSRRTPAPNDDPVEPSRWMIFLQAIPLAEQTLAMTALFAGNQQGDLMKTDSCTHRFIALVKKTFRLRKVFLLQALMPPSFYSERIDDKRYDPPQRISRLRLYARIFVALAFLIILAFWLDYWLRGEMGIAHKFNELMQGRWTTGILIGGGILYVLLLSLPFVPGVELGVLLMCVFGKEGIVFVYFATVAGLSLAFLLGRLLPKDWAESRLQKLGFSRDRDNPDDGIEGMLDTLTRNSRFRQSRFWSFLSRYRYLTIAVLFNIPGNYLIGGGGGISLACGISRRISWKWFLLTVVLAVSPVPLLAFFGVIQLETLLGIPKE